MNYNTKKFSNGYWCDKHNDEVDNRKELVIGTRYDDDECLHGVCSGCWSGLSEDERKKFISQYDVAVKVSAETKAVKKEDEYVRFEEKSEEEYGTVEIDGFSVKFVKRSRPIFKTISDKWVCAYVSLPKSNCLNDETLNNPTYREGDEIGFDTSHGYNKAQSIDQKLFDALLQVKAAIEAYKRVVKQ